MANTTSKIFRGMERILVLATDHRYFGVVAGLENPYEVLNPLLEYTDVLMTSQDVLNQFRNKGGKLFRKLEARVSVILRASMGSAIDVPVAGYLQEPAKLAYRQRTGRDFLEAYESYRNKIESGEELSPDEWHEYKLLDSIVHEPDTMADERISLHAMDVRNMRAQAAAVSVYLGTKYQSQTLENLAIIAREGRMLKPRLPVLGVVAVGKGLGHLEKDADFLTRAGALLAATGADIVKSYNCGKNFEKVVQASGVPVIVAGGRLPKGIDAAKDSLELAYDSIQKGAAGIDFGRRVWRHEHSVAMIRALREVVHRGATVREAYEKFEVWAKEENEKQAA